MKANYLKSHENPNNQYYLTDLLSKHDPNYENSRNNSEEKKNDDNTDERTKQIKALAEKKLLEKVPLNDIKSYLQNRASKEDKKLTGTSKYSELTNSKECESDSLATRKEKSCKHAANIMCMTCLNGVSGYSLKKLTKGESKIYGFDS